MEKFLNSLKPTAKFLERVKNPIFLFAFFAFVYQALNHYGVQVELGTYQQAVDILTYVVLGFGVYSTGKSFKEPENKDGDK
jgi:hypothetical protein